MRRSIFTACFCALILRFCPQAQAATFSVPESALPHPSVLIAYGDMRFTDPAETNATNPVARQSLIAKIASEQPAAIFITGDVPYHGVSADYDVYRHETAPWRAPQLRVYPALGNHEFAACQQPECLERWWTAFPELRGRRWYSVALGSRVLAVALDSDAPLVTGSEQREWLEHEVGSLDKTVRLVMIVMHHPPVADVQTVKLVDHNPRPNEESLVDYLGRVAAHSQASFVVAAGHIHNYERIARGGVLYLVSGGGGAHPYEVDRTPEDGFHADDQPNYHYVRFELGAHSVTGNMIRLNSGTPGAASQWQVMDTFDVPLKP